jgi:hypothetical protein
LSRRGGVARGRGEGKGAGRGRLPAEKRRRKMATTKRVLYVGEQARAWARGSRVGRGVERDGSPRGEGGGIALP